MNKITRNHFALSKKQYILGLKNGTYKKEWPVNLYHRLLDREKEPYYETYKPMLDRMSKSTTADGRALDWNLQSKYREITLRKRLRRSTTQLFMLCDKYENPQDIGYCLVVRPEEELKNQFFPADNDNDSDPYLVREIEQMAIFPEHQKTRRSRHYFHMFFDLFFNMQNFQNVYWSQNGSNHRALERLYRERMKMRLVGRTEHADFRDHSNWDNPERKEHG